MSILYYSKKKSGLADPHWSSVVFALDLSGPTAVDAKGHALSGNWEIDPTGGRFGKGIRLSNLKTAIINSHAAFTLPGPFTVEFFARHSVYPYPQAIASLLGYGAYTAGMLIRNRESGSTELDDLYVRGTALRGPRLIVANDLSNRHIAVSRDEQNVVRLFVGGVLNRSGIVAGTLLQTPENIRLGRSVHAPSTEYLDGVISEFRITKNVCRYSENFAPPSTPFPLF